MERDEKDIIKQRQVHFNEMHPDPDQAQTAAEMLADVEGILEVGTESPVILNLRYDVLKISLEQIESALVETGFHLSNQLIYTLKRALYYYTEETQRANKGCHRGDSNCTRKIFIDHYQRRDHTLRDPRPEHWRRYL